MGKIGGLGAGGDGHGNGGGVGGGEDGGDVFIEGKGLTPSDGEKLH